MEKLNTTTIIHSNKGGPAALHERGIKMKDQMIKYLQSMMDNFQKEKERYGIDDERVIVKLDGMIACKEMVEALIQEPVNLQKDGKVTVGF